MCGIPWKPCSSWVAHVGQPQGLTQTSPQRLHLCGNLCTPEVSPTETSQPCGSGRAAPLGQLMFASAVFDLPVPANTTGDSPPLSSVVPCVAASSLAPLLPAVTTRGSSIACFARLPRSNPGGLLAGCSYSHWVHLGAGYISRHGLQVHDWAALLRPQVCAG